MTALQTWINQGRAGSDIVAPIKARACHALYAVLGNKTAGTAGGPRLMRRGLERC